MKDLSNKNRDKKKKKKLTNKISNGIDVNINLSDDLKMQPNYGCLKNGLKPTYTQLNKTQKKENNGKNYNIFRK